MFADQPLPGAYQLTFEDKGDYLLAKVSGEHDSLKISVSYWREIEREVLARNTRRLLVCEDFANTVPDHEMMSVAMLVSQFQFQNVRFAFVDEHIDQFMQNKLAEMVISERGINVKAFSSFKNAEEWLLQEAPYQPKT